KPEVMGIRRGSAADKTGLSGQEPQMVAIALSHRLYDGDGCWGAGIQLSGGLAIGFPVLCSGEPELAELVQPDLKGSLDRLGVRYRELVLEGEGPLRPQGEGRLRHRVELGDQLVPQVGRRLRWEIGGP